VLFYVLFVLIVLFHVLFVLIVLFYVLSVLIVLVHVLFVLTVLFYVLFMLIVLFHVLFVLIVLFYVLFVCKCVMYYCHWVSTQLQLTNISYHTIRVEVHIWPWIALHKCSPFTYINTLIACVSTTVRNAVVMLMIVAYSFVKMNNELLWVQFDEKLLRNTAFSLGDKRLSIFWRIRSSGMWHCVTTQAVPDILKNCTPLHFEGQAVLDYWPNKTTSYPRRTKSSESSLWEPQTSQLILV
jgi:hypothetical protein